MDLIVCHEAADEIERLREENNNCCSESKRLLDRCISLAEGVETLRELLKECREYVEAGMSSVDSELCDRIEREIG
jgi:hypothetical protein